MAAVDIPPDGGGTDQAAVPVNLMSLSEMSAGIRSLARILVLDSSRPDTDLALLDQQLALKETQEAIKKFGGDAQTVAMHVTRIRQPKDDSGTESGDDSAPPDEISFEISSDMSIGSGQHSTVNGSNETNQNSHQNESATAVGGSLSLVLVKTGVGIEADKPFKSQVQCLTLALELGTPLYQSLRAYVAGAMRPVFNSFVKSTNVGSTEKERDRMVGEVDKRMAELEMGLLHLQQNIDIPEITLVIHPHIMSVIKASSNGKAKVSDFEDRMNDAEFLNQLQAGVQRWTREIKKVTCLERNAATGTTLQEVRFWLNLETALQSIQTKRESHPINLTIDILKQAKRFLATVSFDADTGLNKLLETVADYNVLMRDFPIHELLAATEPEQIATALLSIFNHLKKMRQTSYPLDRAIRLIEAISRDLTQQILKVLSGRRLMTCRYPDFEVLLSGPPSGCQQIFNTWDTEYEKVTSLVRDILKKKRDSKVKIWRATLSHKRLQDRLDQMRKFRQQHDQLHQVIVRVLQKNATVSVGSTPVGEVEAAYETVLGVDALDLSKEGSEAWEAARKRYEERIAGLEQRIASRLRDQLGTCKNAREMFLVFSKYNALFVRPHIRMAIREYQTQLIQHVKTQMDRFHDMFKRPYHNTGEASIFQSHDIPPVAAQIMYIRSIELNLNRTMAQVEDVLGKEWKNHVEGQKLKSDFDSFEMKLKSAVSQLYTDWINKVSHRQVTITSCDRIFDVEAVRLPGSGEIGLKLIVNFHADMITLAKEVRFLRDLGGFKFNLSIMNDQHRTDSLYPFVQMLKHYVKAYEFANAQLVSRGDAWKALSGSNSSGTEISKLVAADHCEVQNLIVEGISLTWQTYKLEPYATKFMQVVIKYIDKVDDVINIAQAIDHEVELIDSAPFDAKALGAILSRIQGFVDQLSLKQCSNLDVWVIEKDAIVEAKLAARLEKAIQAWVKYARSITQNNEQEYEEVLTDGNGSNDENVDPNAPPLPKIEAQRLELRITNQYMYCMPPAERVRSSVLKELSAWQQTILLLPRILHSRYAVSATLPQDQTTYRGLLDKLPSGTAPVVEIYAAIDNLFKDVGAYVDTWLRYQSLWDLQPDALFARLGDNIADWMATLSGIRKARQTFDTSETYKRFGPLLVDFAKVQSKVSLKYDTWHRDVVFKFSALLGSGMSTLHSELSRARDALENTSLDSVASTADSVAFITNVQRLKRSLPAWGERVDLMCEGQKLLERQRFTFPSNWMYSDNVTGMWSALQDILRRKDASIQEKVAHLQMTIVKEDQAVEERTTKFLDEWVRDKPVDGSHKPGAAIKILSTFENKLTRLATERSNVAKARDALELTTSSGSSSLEDKVQSATEELQDLKTIWTQLSGVWAQLDELRDQPWLAVQPRKLRTSLNNLSAELKNLPSRYRQYPSYDYVKKTLTGYEKANNLIQDLKSEAFKDRHWRQLTKKLRVTWSFGDLTLGSVWDSNLLANEPIIREVLAIAQGEKALEEFLKQVADVWKTYVLELVNFQSKCRLIRAWDELFTKVKEHLTSVQAMKLSPFYKQFEEDAVAWEEKLNRILALFDVWIDVQRRWVYLEGIFSGSADIRHLLPVETQRFQSVSTDFLALMRRVAKSPLVLDVLQIPSVDRQLDRLADLLTKIQKALGDYLEKERASFPRFYFVGDEDLLDIIGNSKNIARIQKHFRKMFAGIASVILNDDSTEVLGVASRENETVMFEKPVKVSGVRINEWLAQLESATKTSLAKGLARTCSDLTKLSASDKISPEALTAWLDASQHQLVLLAKQIEWTASIEASLNSDKAGLNQILLKSNETLSVLADCVLETQPAIRRKKLEGLVTVMVHQRDTTRDLINAKISSTKDFDWQRQMRFYHEDKKAGCHDSLEVRMANASFIYGFEYLGVGDRLVQTPLTERCYLTMTQALDAKFGGSPWGPAGTGKTESVKALGQQLGRFVLVFNCDETFDFQAMGRIFVGLCQVGAWGCFDEFNRLEERMLSACSQQIQSIQQALKEDAASGGNHALTIELVGKQVKIQRNMAIFITMNPTYTGRSNLPDNLKKLFRSLAMTAPDRRLIAQVMLFSQGFRTAERLASKVVPFFELCLEQLSPQTHYDFGLRALKPVLVSAGHMRRRSLAQAAANKPDEDADVESSEQELLIQSVVETIVPKLIAADIPLLHSLLHDVFPGCSPHPPQVAELTKHVETVCANQRLLSDSRAKAWMEKVLQLYQIQYMHHGVIMVGPSGSGKTTAWRVLLKALELLDGTEGVAHVLDPKAISKEALYGWLDINTREWTDGLLTATLRRIIDNVRGESTKRHWIVLDGDVDPEWVENMNSVLDDNKLLTLPNGERLAVPPNVRIMFEVADLKFATHATVSRCGMVWFAEVGVTPEMACYNFLETIKNESLVDDVASIATPFVTASTPTESGSENKQQVSPAVELQRAIAACLEPHLGASGLVPKCLELALPSDDSSNDCDYQHVMVPTRCRALSGLFSMVKSNIRQVHAWNSAHTDFPLTPDQIDAYIGKTLVLALVWSLVGDCRESERDAFTAVLRKLTTIPLPPATASLLEFDVVLPGADWTPWSKRVPSIEIETHRVSAPDVVIPTVDTLRHESLLGSWLADHRPLLLCGPPGSGKTMTLLAALRGLPDLEVAGINFSSATTPELVIKTLEQHCELRRTPHGMVLQPLALNSWLVLFCDEINLPEPDQYGTQRVVSFLRQIVQQGGFFRAHDQAFVRLERVQFVGACNPPTDPGRKPLSLRFLRHVPVIYVDYPGPVSLKQIYGTLNRAMLRSVNPLRALAEPLTNAMVDFYMVSQDKFTQDVQPHYIYSPRELSRWVRGMSAALSSSESVNETTPAGLVKLWAHEALRLFQDRLVTADERAWTDERLNECAAKHFPHVDISQALERPILYSDWLTKDYAAVQREQLRKYVKARLKVFYEEELDVPLVLFDDVLEHVLRMDRVFKQSQGHLLLIGVSGSGKTTLSRFVAWINGLSVFQIKVHNKYTAADFDEDLRIVLRRAGCRGEKIAFIMDESNVLDPGFLERMNTLLANAEVPGLFEGDELATLMTACKEGAARDGLRLDSTDELYKWFTMQVSKNLHVVFTMNPCGADLKDRAATSPALFNRCVLNWFGDWSVLALSQVGRELTAKQDIDRGDYSFPASGHSALVAPDLLDQSTLTHRDAVTNAFVFVHLSIKRAAAKLDKVSAVTPRSFLDLLQHFVKLLAEKRQELEEQQRHLNVGLAKIRDTVDQVEELQKSLAVKKGQLEEKNIAANAKLKQMVQEQQEAERQKVTAEELARDLDQASVVIKAKQQDAQSQLDRVQPEVEEAQAAVKGIKKQSIVEIRTLSQPPLPIKLALESICVLLGEGELAWKDIRSVIMRENFINSLLHFDPQSITKEIRDHMAKYMDNPDYTYEKIHRASVACGPLVKFARAVISYSIIFHKVAPLREELASLEKAAHVNQAKFDSTNAQIVQLDKSIIRFKDEYAALIAEAQAIKADLSMVEGKVDRSVALLKSLSSEQERWDAGSTTFRGHMATIVGDALLGAAFLTYAGHFDQKARSRLWDIWRDHLTKVGIVFRKDLARLEYLSTADERLAWHASGLPRDELCAENAVMLERFNRYPLMIDPSGQATAFVMRHLASKKIVRTSFLDESFRKSLESALRFGHPLLVSDVEAYDPILNPVLNRELRRTAGRVLISLGDQDIDLSPSFSIILATRDPNAVFPPDLASRVTVVNFTVTAASLHAQCLNEILRSERPDIEEKRADLVRLQGEYQLRLRQLEQQLLQALNEVRGRILDDDQIIAQLERLKLEAAEVSRKAQETEGVMTEIDAVSAKYAAVAQACSQLFFSLEALSQLHFLYQFSLHFFLDAFGAVLKDPAHVTALPVGSDARLAAISKQLLHTIYERVAVGLLHKDRATLALMLTRIKMTGQQSNKAISASVLDREFDYLTSPRTVQLNSNTPTIGSLSKEQSHRLTSLCSAVPAFKDSVAMLGDCSAWLSSVLPESSIPKVWSPIDDPCVDALRGLLLLQALRPDRVLAGSHVLINTALGHDMMSSVELQLPLETIVAKEVASTSPVLLCCAPGCDASDIVERLASRASSGLTAIALGSPEGFTQADTAIASATKAGRWVLLKNGHLALRWLAQLGKRLQSLTPHSDFRLFLTTEMHPGFPSNLIRLGKVLTFEPPPGIKSNVTRTLYALPAERIARVPGERARLYLLLAWFHATLLERMRYTPLGWAKTYEWNEADLACAADTIDTWLDRAAGGKTNVPPSKIPWTAIRTLLSQAVYGGRIDNPFDQKLLDGFLTTIFSERSFDSDFALVSNIDEDPNKKIEPPDGATREEFIRWVESLSDVQTPSWLGLPNAAEQVLLTARGAYVTSSLLRLQILDVDKDEDVATDDKTRPAWQAAVHTLAQDWLKRLPLSIPTLQTTESGSIDPLRRFFAREVSLGQTLLADVRRDLTGLSSPETGGAKKATNRQTEMMAMLARGLVPKEWRQYTVPVDLSVARFLPDLLARCQQLSRVATSSALNKTPVALGLMFLPEAWVTATRQAIAQQRGWSLEQLVLTLRAFTLDEAANKATVEPDCFPVTGLLLQGAVADNTLIQLSSKQSTARSIAQASLQWGLAENAPSQKSTVEIPVYANGKRERVLFAARMLLKQNETSDNVYQKGVAFIASDLAE